MPIATQGLEDISKAFTEEIQKRKRYTLKGLIKAGMIIRRASQRKTPVDKGNLRQSTYVVWTGGDEANAPAFNDESGLLAQLISSYHETVADAKSALQSMKDIAVEVGFTAPYGIFVHEDLEMQHTVGEAKFLLNAALENRSRIMAAITEEASKS